MFAQIKLLFIALFLGAFLTACGTKTSQAEIEMNMSEQDVIEMMGEPSLSQSHTINDLTTTHIEWMDKDGMLWVKFINGEAKFNGFIPTPDE